MKLLITGGTGLVGTRLVEELVGVGHDVTVLSRKGGKSNHPNLRQQIWNGNEINASVVGPVDGIINLAGAGIADHRWTNDYKKKIETSRIQATKACVNYIQALTEKPKVFINASAVGYYGVKHTKPVTEDSPPGDDFLARTCIKWEATAQGTGIRTVIPRLGVVLAKEGGAFPKLLAPFKLYAGGYIGSGLQGFPWVHIDDVIRAFKFILEHESLVGPINIAAPELLNNRQFGVIVGKITNTPSGMAVPALAVKMMLGESSIIVLEGQFVLANKIINAGFDFKFPKAEMAVRDLIS